MGFWVSAFGFRNPGFLMQGSKLSAGVPKNWGGVGFWVSGFGFRDSGSRFRFRVPGFGFQLPGCGVRKLAQALDQGFGICVRDYE